MRQNRRQLFNCLTNKLLITLPLLLLSYSTIIGQERDFTRIKTKYELKSEPVEKFEQLWKENRQQAREFLSSAIKNANKNEDYETLVYLLEKQSNILRLEGKDSLALIDIRRSIQLAKEHLGKNHMLLAKSYFREGVIWHRQNNFYAAASLFDSAQRVYSSSLSYDSALNKSIIDYKYYAYSYGQLSLDTLTKYLGERIELSSINKGSIEDRVKLLSDYPELYMQKGDLNQALASAIEVVSFTERHEDQLSIKGYITAYFNLGKILYQMGEYERGLKVCDQLLNKFDQPRAPFDTNLESVFNLKAGMLIGLEEYLQAIDIYQHILRNKKIETTSDALTASQYRNNITICYTEINNIRLAQQTLILTLEEIHNLLSFPNKDSEMIYRTAGSVHKSAGNYALSLSYYDSAVRNGIPSYASDDILNFPKIEEDKLSFETLLALMDKCIALIQFYEHSEEHKLSFATASAKYALATHELLIQNRQELIQAGGNLFLSQYFKPLYEAGLQAAYSLCEKGKLEEGLMYANKFFALSKAALLIEQSGEFDKIQNPEVPQTLRSNYYGTMQEIQNLNASFYSLLDEFDIRDNAIENLSQRLSESTNRLVKLKDSVSLFLANNDYEDSYLYERSFDTGLNKSLTSKQVQVEYFAGETQIFIMAKSDQKSQLWKVDIDSVFFDRFKAVINEINSPPNYENYLSKVNRFAENSYTLYETLIAPVLSEFTDEINELIIIPDEYLAKIPFEILLQEQIENPNSFKTLPYLVKKYTVSYDLTSLNNREQKQKRAPKNLLGMGYSQSTSNLSSLPGTEKEIKFLQSKVEGDYYLGDESSKSMFIESAKNYDVLHLAIHGMADTTGGYDSRLVFNGHDDNVLKTSDLYLAGLKARLAILSACESGLGKINKGEGVFSIARGFIIVGVPSIVMSLWSVNDRITSDLMVDMHLYMNQKRMPINQALAETKRDYITSADNYTSHPYFWAAFISLGSPIQLENDTVRPQINIVIILSLAFVALAITTLLIRKRKKRIM